MKKQFMVQESDPVKRREFYNYIHETYHLEEHFQSMEEIETSKFPFVVDFKESLFWICSSITCCACAAQRNRIISIDEFMIVEETKQRKRLIIKR